MNVMNDINQSLPERSQVSVTEMSTHAILKQLRAALGNPSESTLEQLKADGWFTPLWMEGSSTTAANGQMAIGFSATELEGCERPVLFTYVDESQARHNHPGTDLMSHSLNVLSLLALQQTFDVAVLDGEDSAIADHSQLLGLRNYMTAEAGLESRNAKSDEMFIARLNAYMLQACRYCEQQPDIRCLHLAAMAMGAAPMRAILLLDANNALFHQNKLEKMYETQMLPGDDFMVLDRLEPMEQDWLKEISKLVPVYAQQTSAGWWARLLGRFRQPRLGLLAFSISPETEAS